MGQDVAFAHFKRFDFQRFERLYDREAALLGEWFRDRRFSRTRSIGGLELETWLVDAGGAPAPRNMELIDLVGSPNVVPELSRFNVEFNVAPQPLADRGIEAMQLELDRTWRMCDARAAELGLGVVAIGTLPTLTDQHLTLRNMSPLNRYLALNEQTLRLRQGRPIRLHITGRERLETWHHDVMLESATTSFQMHLQVPQDEAARTFNAASIVAAPLLAVSVNAPLLFGYDLWDETRVPLCEQAVDVGGGRFSRVTFGSGYARESLEEFFIENRDQYPVMLPLAMDDASDRLAHLRLHNGTIWRWIRPLIGFDDDGTPHLRIEQRVVPAGPTTIDMAANMALYYGLMEAFAKSDVPPEARLSFAAARENFYAAAKSGLEGEFTWFHGVSVTARDLLLRELLPLAASGLEHLQVNKPHADRLLQIIESRASGGQTGACWQRRFLERHGRNMAALTLAYRQFQQAGAPVHTWPV